MLAFLLLSAPADAYVYFTVEQITAAYFPGETPVQQEWRPAPEDNAWLKSTLGYEPAPAYALLSGTDAVAVLDEQIGQHEPISIATLVGTDLKVRRVEVMVYREAYGEAVRAPAFRGQFVGLGLSSPMRAGREIQVVSGATLSSRALSTAVRRAVALVQAFLT